MEWTTTDVGVGSFPISCLQTTLSKTQWNLLLPGKFRTQSLTSISHSIISLSYLNLLGAVSIVKGTLIIWASRIGCIPHHCPDQEKKQSQGQTAWEEQFKKVHGISLGLWVCAVFCFLPRCTKNTLFKRLKIQVSLEHRTHTYSASSYLR